MIIKNKYCTFTTLTGVDKNGVERTGSVTLGAWEYMVLFYKSE
jgi:hypothetical protein